MGCKGEKGICGKVSDTALLQDELTASLIDLARSLQAAGETPTAHEVRLFVDGLFLTGTNVNFDDQDLGSHLARVRSALESRKSAAKGFDMKTLWDAEEDVRSLKTLILLGLRGIAAYAHHAAVLGSEDAEANAFFATGLAAIAQPDLAVGDLLPLAMQTGQINLRIM